MNQNASRTRVRTSTEAQTEVKMAYPEKIPIGFQKQLQSVPKSIFFILLFGICESFCYYGIKALLYLFLTQKVKLPDVEIFQYFHVFVAVCYASSLGGYIFSNYCGRLPTILISSMLFLLGSIVLFIVSIEKLQLPIIQTHVIGFAITAIGIGGIKSGLVIFATDQFQNKFAVLKSWILEFYYLVHLGAAISSLSKESFTRKTIFSDESNIYAYGYMLMGGAMLLGILILVVGLLTYKLNYSKGLKIMNILKCYICSLTGPCSQETAIIQRISKMFLPLSIFWCVFDQMATSWILQAKFVIEARIGKPSSLPFMINEMYPIEEHLIISLHAFYTLLTTPIFIKIVSLLIRRPLHRITFSMILTGASFAVPLFMENFVLEVGENSVIIQVISIQYFTMMMAESLIVVSGLEFIISEVPSSLHTILYGFWFLAHSIDNLLVALIKVKINNPQTEAYIYLSMMSLSAIIFICVTRNHKPFPRVEIVKSENQQNKRK